MSDKTKKAKEMAQLMPVMLMNMFPYIFGPIDVPPSQVLTLVCIERRKGCNLTDLKNDLHVSAPTVSGIIDRLERDKFIESSQDQKDRRVKNVSITKKGLAVTQNLRNNIEHRWDYIFSKLSDKQVGEILRTVSLVTTGFTDGTI